MTGKLEWLESQDDGKARTTGKPERPDWSLRQYIGERNVYFLNRQRGPNYWDFADFLGVHLASPIHKEYWMRQYIGAIIIERNIFVLLCLLLNNRLLILLDWAETEIRFYRKTTCSIWIHPRSPIQRLSSPLSFLFLVTIYL